MDSFKAAETSLYNHFVAAGRSHDTATRIASVFTQFMLGYLTALGAINYIVEAGLTEVEARAIVRRFASEKQKIIDRAERQERVDLRMEHRAAEGC